MLKQARTETPFIETQHTPELAAQAVGLEYVSPFSPGYTRRKKNRKFEYFDMKGHRIQAPHILRRIEGLALPPAWSDVWICPNQNGHLQATGYDSKKRKQYRYHSEWNQFRNQTKFTKMVIFAQKLPGLRLRLQKDMKRHGYPREKILASVVCLMEKTLIRIGNEEYAEKNNSFGLTTLKNHHARIRGAKIRLQFKGKSHKWHDVEVEDPKLARIVRKCQDLPGQDLFAYETESGEVVDVTSQDINLYLREITSEEITAKDFRTWGGTVRAAVTLAQMKPCQNQKELNKQILKAVKSTADQLRNTPAICRKYYIHPCVLQAFEDGKIFKVKTSCEKSRAKLRKGLYSEEYFTFKLLQQALNKNKLQRHRPGRGS